jgi:iron only hydrogenase large subunit-like protein
MALPMYTQLFARLDQFRGLLLSEILPKPCPLASPPQQMMGAMIKTYYAKKIGRDPKDIVVVSVMPCYREEIEAHRAR